MLLVDLNHLKVTRKIMQASVVKKELALLNKLKMAKKVLNKVVLRAYHGYSTPELQL